MVMNQSTSINFNTMPIQKDDINPVIEEQEYDDIEIDMQE